MNVYLRAFITILGSAMVIFCITRLMTENVIIIRGLTGAILDVGSQRSDESPPGSISGSNDPGQCDPSKQRLLIFVRHAVRLFRKSAWDSWLEKNFDEKGNYVPVREDYPATLPTRTGGVPRFQGDPPLHGDGIKGSIELGQLFKTLNISIRHAYSSLPLRCLETAEEILKGNGNSDVEVNMESGFHERAMNKDEAWYMTPRELNENGHNVNESYQSFWPGFDLEHIPLVHKRIYTVTQKVLDAHEDDGGNILVVGHANTGEMTMALMTGLPVPSNFIYYRKIRDACKIHNLAATIFREGCNKDDPFNWYRYEHEDIPILHDWKCMGTILNPENSIYALPNGTWVMQNEETPEDIGTIKSYEVNEDV